MLNWLVSRYRDWIADRAGRRTASEGPPDETDVAESSDGAAGGFNGKTGESVDTRTSWQDLVEQEEVSKQDVQLELGLQPHEFLVWLVRYSDGHMWQAEMVETTGWSKSTVSRYLDTLESSGLVERIQVGRRKLVGVPGEMPDPVPTSDGPPAEPASGSRFARADETA